MIAATPVVTLDASGDGTAVHTDAASNVMTLTVVANEVTAVAIVDSVPADIASATLTTPVALDALYTVTPGNITLDYISDTDLLAAITTSNNETSKTAQKLIVEEGSSTFDGETHSHIYVFTENWDLVSGIETRGATTTEYGPGWSEKGSTTDVMQLLPRVILR